MSVSQLVLGVLASIVGGPSDVQKSMIQGAETTNLTRADIGLTSRGGEGGGIGGTSLSTRVTSTDNYSGLLVDKAFDKSDKEQSDRAQVSMSPRATQALISSGVLSQLNTEPTPQENRTFGQAGNFSDIITSGNKDILSSEEESSLVTSDEGAKTDSAPKVASSAPSALDTVS